MPNQTVSLSEDLSRVLDAQVASGRFPTREAALERAVVLLDGEAEEYRRKLLRLNDLIGQAEEEVAQGKSIMLESEDDVHAFIDGAFNKGAKRR